MHRFRPIPSVFGLTLALAVPAALPALVPIVETRADETRPRLAYDETHDRFLAVWETGGGVSARLLDAGGAPIGDPIPLFWAGSTFTYDAASVTFKTGQDQYYVVARQNMVPFPGGQSVAVKIVSADGAVVSQRFHYPTRTGVNLPSRHTIVADGFGSDCCVLVAWEDEITRNVDGMLLEADLDVHVAPFRIAAGSVGTGRAVNPFALYRRDWDLFLVVYELDRSSGPTYVASRQIGAFTGEAVGGELPLHDRGVDVSSGPHPAGLPRVARHPVTGVFLVSWWDAEAAHVEHFDTDGPFLVRIPDSYRAISRTGPGAQIVIDSPVPVAPGSGEHFRVFVDEKATPTSTVSSTVVYTVRDLFPGGVSATRSVVSGTSTGMKSNVAAAFSPLLDRMVLAWQVFTSPITNLHDLWGERTAP